MAEPDSPVNHTPTNKKQFSDLLAQKKILSSFRYKAILFAIFVAFLPMFPPQTPDATNSTFLSRIRELLRLLLVGIAVSYGLFSQCNADPEVDKDKDAGFKADTPQSYVSKILQVSSVFDVDTATEESKVETWSSQYHSPGTIVVESKPLVLPVRSLRESRVQNPYFLGSSSVVLPSPIPWWSRSGRMEVGDEGHVMAASSPASPFYAKAGSFSAELREKTNEDSIGKKSFNRATPPPAPPPPPPPFSHGSLLFERRELKKSLKEELNDLSIKGRKEFLKNSSPDAKPKQEISSSPRSVGTVRSKEVLSAEKPPALLQQKYQTVRRNKQKVEFMEKIMLDSSKREEGGDSYDDEESADSIEAAAEAKENEVDKKADEFIAKFREQIRLQRIESIKKSSRHREDKNSIKKR